MGMDQHLMRRRTEEEYDDEGEDAASLRSEFDEYMKRVSKGGAVEEAGLRGLVVEDLHGVVDIDGHADGGRQRLVGLGEPSRRSLRGAASEAETRATRGASPPALPGGRATQGA